MNKVHLMGYRKLSSVQKITCITEIADKKLIIVFCVLGYCTPHISALFKVNSFFNISSWNSERNRKKANQQLYEN